MDREEILELMVEASEIRNKANALSMKISVLLLPEMNEKNRRDLHEALDFAEDIPSYAKTVYRNLRDIAIRLEKK